MSTSYLTLSQRAGNGPATDTPDPALGYIGPANATYSLAFLISTAALRSYNSYALRKMLAGGTLLGGQSSATNPTPAADSGYTGDQYNHYLTIGLTAEDWGQIRDATLFLTSNAVTAETQNWYEIDNIPNVSVKLGNHPTPGSYGAVPLTITNVQNLQLDMTQSPYQALANISTAAPLGKSGILRIESGPAGGFFIIDDVNNRPGDPLGGGFIADGSTQTLYFTGGKGGDTLLATGFAGREFVDMGSNSGTAITQNGDVVIPGITVLIPPNAPPGDAPQMDAIWGSANALLGNFSLVAKYAVGTLSEQETVVKNSFNGGGRVGAFTSLFDVTDVSLPPGISGIGVSDPASAPVSDGNSGSNFGLNGGYSVGGQIGHDELDYNWSPSVQASSATVTLESDSVPALLQDRIGVELFDGNTLEYSRVLSIDPGSVQQLAGPPGAGGTVGESATITLANITDSHGRLLTWNAMRFIGEPVPANGVTNGVVIGGVALHNIAQLSIDGGDSASLGYGTSVIDYLVGKDGVQSYSNFLLGKDQLVLEGTSLANVHAAQYGDTLGLTFGSYGAGFIALQGITDIAAAQHLHASGANVVFS